MDRDYERVERAIRFVEAHAPEQPSLARVARHVGLGPHHLQRVFKRWAGLSPKRFLQFLTAEHAKRLLAESRPVLDTAFEVGLSGGGRLHDLLLAVEAVTPGEYKRRGEGLAIRWGIHPTPFGDCVVGVTGRGVCALSFLDDRDAPAELHESWPGAELREDPAATRDVARAIFAGSDNEVPVFVRGTNFQIRVWHALLRIPEGALTSYSDLARRLGRPTAARAVAGAVARNPVGYVIPCHRVLRRSGAVTGYRWGPTRKRAILARETAQQPNAK